jgi:hypothetical protein
VAEAEVVEPLEEPPEARAGQAREVLRPDLAPTREWVAALRGDPPVHQLVRPIPTHLWRRALE